jgi:hypothetical protein
MEEHHEPGLGEDPGEPFKPVFLHPCIAMGHGDGGMRAHLHLGLEEPTAEAIAALDLEVYVAPLDHQSSIVTRPLDKGSRLALAIKPLPDIVDRILVEARIEIVRDVANMRRGQRFDRVRYG